MASECLSNFIWGKWEWEPDKEDYDSWYIDDQAVVWGWAKSWLFQTNENFDTCIVYFYLDLSWKPSVLLIFAKYLIIFYVTEYSVLLFCSALNSAFLVLYRNHYHSCFCGGFSLSLFFFFPPSPMSYTVFDFCTSVKYIDPSFGQRSLSPDVMKEDSQK